MDEKLILPELPADLLQLRRAAASAIVSVYRCVGAQVRVTVELQGPPPAGTDFQKPCDPNHVQHQEWSQGL